MPVPDISFVFEQKIYKVPMATYDRNSQIVLPDGRVLQTSLWLESYPPQPSGLEVVPTLFANLSAEEVVAALGTNAFLAEEVTV